MKKNCSPSPPYERKMKKISFLVRISVMDSGAPAGGSTRCLFRVWGWFARNNRASSKHCEKHKHQKHLTSICRNHVKRIKNEQKQEFWEIKPIRRPRIPMPALPAWFPRIMFFVSLCLFTGFWQIHLRCFVIFRFLSSIEYPPSPSFPC